MATSNSEGMLSPDVWENAILGCRQSARRQAKMRIPIPAIAALAAPNSVQATRLRSSELSPNGIELSPSWWALSWRDTTDGAVGWSRTTDLLITKQFRTNVAFC